MTFPVNCRAIEGYLEVNFEVASSSISKKPTNDGTKAADVSDKFSKGKHNANPLKKGALTGYRLLCAQLGKELGFG